jgi:hypothetical protein
MELKEHASPFENRHKTEMIFEPTDSEEIVELLTEAVYSPSNFFLTLNVLSDIGPNGGILLRGKVDLKNIEDAIEWQRRLRYLSRLDRAEVIVSPLLSDPESLAKQSVIFVHGQ